MKTFRSLSTKLIIALLLPLSLLMLLATWIETHMARQSMIDMAETAAVNLSDSAKEELQGILRSTRIGTEALSLPLAALPRADEETVDSLLTEVLERFPLIYGTTLAFDPQTDSGWQPRSPYLYRHNGVIQRESLAGDDYRYWEWPWFIEPLQSGKPDWSPPYYDEGGGGVRMVTFSVPLEINSRRAVLTADLELGFLSSLAESNLLGRTGSILVFDASGRLVTHPRNDWILERSLDDLAALTGISALGAVAGQVARGEQLWLRPEDGVHAGIMGDDETFAGRLFARPLNEAGWGVLVYFSDQDFLAGVDQATRFRLIFTFSVLILLASILALVSQRGLRPLGELADRTRHIAQGHFSDDTPGMTRNDEIGRLSRAFHRMQDHLRQYISDLTQATAARERLEGELATARQIQQSLVPVPNPDPATLGVELNAFLRPARAVGGDLYYYRRVAENRVFFAIGDVSDKGVPAALFMARASALLGAVTKQGRAPEAMLETVNIELCEDNEHCMFATLLLGMLDLASGKLRMASAGHEPPLLLHGRGEVAWVQVPTGPPAGIDEEAEFELFEITMQSGDMMMVYTDGVTEALNEQKDLFGDERLLAEVTQMAGEAGDLHPEDVLSRVVGAVDRFASNMEQADDMTLLAFRLPPA